MIVALHLKSRKEGWSGPSVWLRAVARVDSKSDGIGSVEKTKQVNHRRVPGVFSGCDCEPKDFEFL